MGYSVRVDEKIWKEWVVAEFNVLSSHSAGGSEKNHEQFQSESPVNRRIQGTSLYE
jgi:hypothetical protein